MKARLIRETMYAQPGGNLTDDRGFEMEDLEQVIQNTEGKTLYPRDLANFVDFFIEMGDQNAADKLLFQIIQLHPYIAKEIQEREGPYRDQIGRFVEFYDGPGNANQVFPPLSMN